MAKQVTKTSFAASVGDKGRAAFNAHKDDETKFGGGGNLPAGVNGVARLAEIKFTQIAEGKQNAGQWMFYAAGIVVSPTMHEGIPIEGLRTSISEPLFDTPNKKRATFDEHFAWVLNEFRKLGVKTSEITLESIEQVGAALKKAQPYFRFNTFAGDQDKWEKVGGKFVVTTREGKKTYATEAAMRAAHKYLDKEPMIFHNWNGVIANYVPEEGSSDVEDTSGDEPATEDAGGDEPPTEDTATASDEGGEVDLDALAEAADADNDSAEARQLNEIAQAHGIDAQTIDTWAQVVELIRANQGGEESTESTDEASEAVDFAALGEKADEGDDEAITELSSLGEGMGIPVEDHNDKTYAEYAALLAETAGGSSEETPEEAQEFVVEKGQVYLYGKEFDKAGKLVKSKKAVEHEVLSSNTSAKTCTLKSLTTNKPLLDPKTKKPLAVKWDDLEQG